ncbi:hypothetical protein E1180_20505 [Roseibium denhamense]|uniref:Uncharacterized protein n=1 Tax=Roseibium denhamense TaxID=76305 RepID=A0ABY1NPC7_9HYPH|nr:hypothetical protein [Roseibium denhamense]MTI07886.1 hypothetical protein [Roseibium denhamense]SMP14731.1 hypothetical protein SAMN06265374_1468 [Roseibium denhamense]
MSIRNALVAALMLFGLSFTSYAHAGGMFNGDIYMISRDLNETFRGSHKIYQRKAKGLIEVQYCGRSYWVRYATVAWTQLEVEQRFVVRVESNWGKGWRPICANPEQQVNLARLGISEDPRVVMQNDGATVNRVNRFAAIRDSFRPAAGDKPTKSYHAN